MDHCRCGSGVCWCARADALFDVPGMHVLEVQREPDRLVLTVESDAEVAGCPSRRGRRRAQPASPRGRRRALLRDTVQGAVAQADLALPGAGLPAGHVQRGASDAGAAGQADHAGGRLGHRRPGQRRVHHLGAGPPSRRWPATSGWTGTHAGTPSRSRPTPAGRPGPAAQSVVSLSQPSSLKWMKG